jgi:hypothetical protein
MKEREYIAATDLAKVNAAMKIMADVFRDDAGVKAIRQRLRKLEDDLRTEVNEMSEG